MAQQRSRRRGRAGGPGKGPGPLAQGLRRLWWIPLGAFLVFALIGVAWSATKKAEYSSTAQVVVKGFDNLSTQLSSTGGGSLQDPNKTVATLRRLVKVDEIVDNVATDVGLPASATREIKKRTAVETQVDSDLIGITVTWPDRAMSSRLAQATAEEFVRYRARLDTAPLLAAQRDIRERIDALGSEASAAYVQQLLNTEIDLRTRIAIGSHNSEVASRASEPEQVAPTPVKTAIMFGIGGLALSLFLVAVLQAGDNRVRSESEAGKALGTAVLGVIPRPRSAGADALVMLDDAASAAAEPYRVLATNMRLSGAGRERRTVMIAPVQPDTTATALAGNIAAASARSGRLVALVDLDFRRPQVGDMFELEHALGAGDVLSGEATLDDALHPVALGDEAVPRRTRARRRNGRESEHVVGRTKGLWVMPAGAIAGSPADLAASGGMADLIAELREKFELVLLDVPPWVVAGDALAIGQHVDAVLAVVPSGVTRRSLSTMRRGLQQLRTHVLGMAYSDARTGGATPYAEAAYGPISPETAQDEASEPSPVRGGRLGATLRGWGRG